MPRVWVRLTCRLAPSPNGGNARASIVSLTLPHAAPISGLNALAQHILSDVAAMVEKAGVHHCVEKRAIARLRAASPLRARHCDRRPAAKRTAHIRTSLSGQRQGSWSATQRSKATRNCLAPQTEVE